MFVIARKPDFYNYPLTQPQHSQIQGKYHQVTQKISALQQEINNLRNKPNFHQYAHYSERLQQKLAILREEANQYSYILDVHSNIYSSVQSQKQQRSEVQYKLLENYKAVIKNNQERKRSKKQTKIKLQQQLLYPHNLNNPESSNTSSNSFNQYSLAQIKMKLGTPQIKSNKIKYEKNLCANKSQLMYSKPKEYKLPPILQSQSHKKSILKSRNNRVDLSLGLSKPLKYKYF